MIDVPREEDFARLYALLHDKPAGHHTAAAQFTLGTMYSEGAGVAEDPAEALRWWVGRADRRG